MKFHFSIEEASRELENNHNLSILMLQHGTMQLKYYVPKLIDKQIPHKQDEIYIIASGHAIFYRSGEKINCKKGDALFVPATMEHRFENFTEDFSAWVIFYGKEGGENLAVFL
jgi:mannose-6-phosphate isomerase-like protein (cupin superfamily)